jgi:hypothetical protein
MVAVIGCASDGPALTMEFAQLPDDAGDITVTLAADGVRFAGADAGMPGGVSVSYAAGTIVVAVDRAYAASHAHRIRLPLKASKRLQLLGTAMAAAVPTPYVAVAEATIDPGGSATLKFDFGVAGAGGDAGQDADASNKILPPDGGPDALPDGAPDPAPDARETGMPVDAPGDAPVDAPGDVPVDAPGDNAADTPADLPDKSLDAPPGDVPTPPIATNCVVGGLHAASVGAASGSPTVAASGDGVFGLAWLGAAGNVLYNAVDATGMRQSAADVVVVPAATGVTFATPRLAAVAGTAELMLAFGRRNSGGARAAVMRVAARSGAVVGAEVPGTNLAGAAAPPEIGGVAIKDDGSRVAVISRRADLGAATQTNIDLFSGVPSFLTVNVSALPMTRTAGIAWHPAGRFLAGAIVDATSGGGRIQELADADLGVGRAVAFTAAPDIPLVGSGAATIAVTAARGGMAVVWLDGQSCTGCAGREVFLATVDSNGNRLGEVQVSAGGSATKSFPHVVFDGAAIAVAWLEFTSIADSQIKLRRFDAARVPVAPAMNIGPRGTASLGDLGIAAAGTGDYGVAFGLSGGTQNLAHVTCTGN